jgi:prolyl oligopeptidase
LTEGYLAAVPQRGAIRDRITQLWNYERYSAPYKEGGRYFYSKNDGLQNQSVLYVADAPDKDGRVLLDPNKLSENGTVALAGTAVSEDGKRLAYGLASAGSDWTEWRVKNIDTARTYLTTSDGSSSARQLAQGRVRLLLQPL